MEGLNLHVVAIAMPLEIKHNITLLLKSLSSNINEQGHGRTFMHQNSYLKSTHLIHTEANEHKNLHRAVCTGCAIKNGTHSFNHKCSHDRNPSNFKTTFICYYTELSFEVYNSFLGQLI